MPRFVSTVAKKVLPGNVIDRYRRRRALRRYLRSLSYEIYDRQKVLRVEELEGAVLARRPDITERLMKDLLERMDVVLQELHREVEGVRARHGTELRELRDEMDRLRAAFQELQSRSGMHQPAAD